MFVRIDSLRTKTNKCSAVFVFVNSVRLIFGAIRRVPESRLKTGHANTAAPNAVTRAGSFAVVPAN
jgi:hypothetical protein